MPRLHLTDLVVQRLSAIGIYYDTKSPAFGIRVGKNRKAWVITRGTDRHRITVGHYPAMSLANARKEARKLLTEPVARHAGMRFEQAYELFEQQHIQTKKARTQHDYKRMIERHLAPQLGTKRLVEISYEDVTAITDKLPPSERAHCLAVGRMFLRWCVQPPRRYIPHSPLEGVKVKTGNRRKRVLKSDELKRAWTAAAKQGYPHGTIVQLLAATGQRRGEIANLRWSWINEQERTIVLPEWVTKNSREHAFPYGQLVADILTTVPRRNATDLLFPSKISDERPLSGWSKYKKQLNDGVEGWTLHDLRRTCRSRHAEIGTPREIAERLINHVAGVTTDVEQIYDLHTYLPEMRKAVEAYESHLATLLATAASPLSQAA